uniref:SDR family NAD(P)-dependent oxidoreductase n=1 Tax=Leersia perrieri TaxID=77586 RepID=A0A0D9X454_9ORYZ
MAAPASRSQRWSLAGKTTIVTGGTKGIGRAIVEELAGFGVRNAGAAGGDGEITGSVCDVSARGDREALVAATRKVIDGRLDILVNNVGQMLFAAAADTSPTDYARIMATNLESSFHLSQLLAPK